MGSRNTTEKCSPTMLMRLIEAEVGNLSERQLEKISDLVTFTLWDKYDTQRQLERDI